MSGKLETFGTPDRGTFSGISNQFIEIVSYMSIAGVMKMLIYRVTNHIFVCRDDKSCLRQKKKKPYRFQCVDCIIGKAAIKIIYKYNKSAS